MSKDMTYEVPNTKIASSKFARKTMDKDKVSKPIRSALISFLLMTLCTNGAISMHLSCEEIANLQLPDVRILEAVAVVPDTQATNTITVSHCRIAGGIG